jgi:hypothetical protein
MSLWNALGELFRRPAARRGVRPRGPAQGRHRPYRPRLEMLEDRTLLSVFTVNHLADDLVGSGLNGSLRYCITSAANGDSITFGVTGTIQLTGELPLLTHSLSIEGPGADLLTVRGNIDGYYAVFTTDCDTTVSISGLTISNGGDNGILNDGTLTLNDCTVSGNADGGIWDDGELVTLNNCTVTGNLGGGGIVSIVSTLVLNNCTVTVNSAYGYEARGGGINCVDGTVMLNNCTVSGNSAYGDEAADGGGIRTRYSTVTLTNCTVSGNNAVGGGGIFNSYGALTLTNCTVSGNHASGDGGGILNGVSGTLTLNSSTVCGNSASFRGGGIWNGNFLTLHVRNTIIAANTAPTGPDLYGSLGSQGRNLIGNTQGGSGFDPTDLLNVNPLLGPLQNNGGPTQTMALLAGSPALNAGNPSQLGTPDQRGVVRAGGVNIGAYQASASAFVLTVPGTVAAGTPFDVTVQVVDVFGQVAFGYTGTVTFRVTDPDSAVVLPLDYTFTANDAGTHTFSGAFILITPGDQTLTVADLANGLSKDGTLTVNP